MSAMNIQLRRKGTITLPMRLRRKYDLDENDVFTLEDLGDGSFLLIPQASNLARLGDRVAQVMAEQEVDLEDMLDALDEERKTYYREHYGRP